MGKRIIKTVGIILGLLIALTIVLMAITTEGTTSRHGVVHIYEKNQAILAEAVQNGTVESLSDLEDVQKISVCDWSDCIVFVCGSKGIVTAGSEYGFYYSPSDNLTGAFSLDDDITPTADGVGFRWEEAGNRFYVEEIGAHFFYYKAIWYSACPGYRNLVCIHVT